ncbi:MAG: hypothetical protein E7160_00570 [Firmicutes bacterium]|nr:hypothetical protein [Bacillota bacterium]
MLLRELDFDNMSVKELEDAIIFNQREKNRMLLEIKKLEINEIVSEITHNKITTVPKKEQTKEEKMEDDELNYYYEDLKNIKYSDNLYNDIKDILPAKKNYRYKELLRKLKLNILKDKKEIERFITEENITDPELLEEFNNEINLNKRKIDIISIISKEQEKEGSNIEEIENNLIFTTTPTGNIRVLEEIKSIDQSFYEKINTLFESIKDGTFKNVKRFTGNNKFSKYREVREDLIRVVFDRISAHDYVIVTVFTKKTTNDRGYQLSLENKISKYKDQKDSILKNIDNDEYRKLHKEYEIELFNRLKPQEAKKQKKKVGGPNE